jgi:putative flavoprotein involved in K+ transport
VDLPVFDEVGMPRHERGAVAGEPGLYFVGLPFIHAFSSAMIHGVGRDAAHIAALIAKRVAGAAKTASITPISRRALASRG